MILRHWMSPDRTKESWYINDAPIHSHVKFFLTINTQGRLLVMGGNKEENSDIKKELIAIGLSFEPGQTALDLTRNLNDLSLLDTTKRPALKSIQGGAEQRPIRISEWHRQQNSHRDYTPITQRRSPFDLYRESLNMDVSTAPFRDATIKKAKLTVDSREPKSLYQLMSKTKLGASASIEALPVGDVWVELGKRLIIFERKTVNDFYSSIISHHMHSQAERMYEFQKQMECEGLEVQIHWLIEHEADGEIGLYHSLKELKQVDGVIAYLSGILGQHVNHAYSMNHLCYLAMKKAQCHLERELFYPVKCDVRNVRIDRSKKDRDVLIEAVNLASGSQVSGSGVIRANESLVHQLAYLPGASSRVAKNLAALGKSFAEITQMTKEELLAVHGVGEKTAESLHSFFNGKNT